MIDTRKVALKDWDVVAGLYRQLNTIDHQNRDALSKESFVTLLAHPGTWVFGAEKEGVLGAMATLHLLPNVTYGGRPFGVIENVVTDQAMRGLGLGRAAMMAAIDYARSAQAYKVMLLTGHANKAHVFYEKLGFSADEKAGMILRF